MKIIKSILFICISIICMSVFSIEAEAKTVFKKGTVEAYENIDFTLKRNRVLYFTFDVSTYYQAKNNNTGVEVTFEGYSEEDYSELYSETFKLKIPKGSTEASFWYYPDEEMEAGYYILSIDSIDELCDVKYTIAYYDCFSESIDIPDKLSVKTNKSKKLNITNVEPDNSFHGAYVESSNNSIATVVDYGEEIYIKGKKKGTCTITATLMNGDQYKCKVTVVNNPSLKWTSYRIPKGSTFKNELRNVTGKVKWSTSNKNVATVTSDGKIKGVGFGKCTIKATSNGKTYSCKVTVYRLAPNYTAYIDDYDTRNNRFQVWFYNHGKRDLVIYSENAKAIDDDYKSYDRNLRLKKGSSSIVVKAGKRKLINFYVKGNTTWFDENDFTIRYYIKYHGKKYKARATAEIDFSDYYVKDKGWYYTYWNDVDPWEDYNL